MLIEIVKSNKPKKYDKLFDAFSCWNIIVDKLNPDSNQDDVDKVGNELIETFKLPMTINHSAKVLSSNRFNEDKNLFKLSFMFTNSSLYDELLEHLDAQYPKIIGSAGYHQIYEITPTMHAITNSRTSNIEVVKRVKFKPMSKLKNYVSSNLNLPKADLELNVYNYNLSELSFVTSNEESINISRNLPYLEIYSDTFRKRYPKRFSRGTNKITFREVVEYLLLNRR